MDTQFLGQGGLLETFSSDHFDIENTASIDNNWMEVEMDLTNESTMSLFQALEEVEEVKEEETTTNSSLLSNLINQCGIPLEEQQEKINTPSSPSNSMNSDMETHQSLIEELEEFFCSPTNIESEQDPGAWTWSPRHQWPPSPPTPSWRLWQVGRCTCLKARTSPSPRRSSRAQCPPPASLRTGRTRSLSSPHPPPPTPTSTPRTRILNGFQARPALSAHPALCEPSPASREL